MAVERIQERDTIAKASVNWTHYLKGLTDWKPWVHAFIQFCWNYSFASLNNFTPTIIKNLGYTSVKAQGLSAPPYLGAFLCCVAAAFISDRWGKRGPIIAFLASVALVGYLILTIVGNSVSTGARYAGIWFACCGTFPIVALNLTWILNNAGNDSKKGSSVAIVALVGQLTSFIGSSVFYDKAAQVSLPVMSYLGFG
jgi:MFS family permease